MRELIIYHQKDEKSGFGSSIPYLTARADGTFEPLNKEKKPTGT